MPSEARIEQLAQSLGIESIPEIWYTYRPDFEAWASDVTWELPSDAAEVYDLPPECLPDLRAMYDAIRSDEALTELADFWHYIIYHLPEEKDRPASIWAVPDELLDHSRRLFELAVMVSGADHAVGNFRRTGVSDRVIADTLCYIGRYARDVKWKRGVWGLESSAWLSRYMRAEIFRLGRLTYKAGRYAQPFRAFRNRRTGEIVTLCEPPAKYHTDGQADGANGIFDSDAWTPRIEIGPDSVTGHPVSPEYTALRETVWLSMQEWDQVLAKGDWVVDVHIAGGSKLDLAECVESYRQAIEFYPRYHPEAEFKAFCCSSWLLDPRLPIILPPSSNIVQFQRPFHLLPVAGSEAQCYDLVFGSSTVDPTTFACTTSLQRAIADYVRAGNRMCSASGFFTWDEAIEMTKEIP